MSSPVKYSDLSIFPDGNADIYAAHLLIFCCNFPFLILSSIVIINVRTVLLVLFYVFSSKIIKVNHFLYFVFVLLDLISSFLRIRFLLVPYAYVPIELIDCILLSSRYC